VRKPLLYAALVAVILLASWRIGASIYEYELSVIDKNAPAIPGEFAQPPTFIPDPPPPNGKLPKSLPPDEKQNENQHPFDPNAPQIITI